MEPVLQINNLLGNIDIYLLDQIMKGRYHPDEKILDAGCGRGRNLRWFIASSYQVFGIDQNAAAIEDLQIEYPLKKENFVTGLLEKLPYPKEYFHHVLCNAVLHFALNQDHFHRMFEELIRVLKPKGSIFIRMTSDIGLDYLTEKLPTDVYDLADGSVRYLINEAQIQQLKSKYNLIQIEPIKSVLVEGKRSMTTLVLEKN